MNKFRGQDNLRNSAGNKKPALNVIAPGSTSDRKPDIRPTAQEVVDNANSKNPIKAPAAGSEADTAATDKTSGPAEKPSDGNVNA